MESSFFFDLIQSMAHIEIYMKHLRRELVKLTDNMFNIEQQLAHMKIPHVSKILDMYA